MSKNPLKTSQRSRRRRSGSTTSTARCCETVTSRGAFANDALTGMTSNPTIFEKALAEGTEYDDQIRSAPGEVTALELFELDRDDRRARRVRHLPPVYDATKGADGFVSIEVSPGAANDATATISEAHAPLGDGRPART